MKPETRIMELSIVASNLDISLIRDYSDLCTSIHSYYFCYGRQHKAGMKYTLRERNTNEQSGLGLTLCLASVHWQQPAFTCCVWTTCCVRTTHCVQLWAGDASDGGRRCPKKPRVWKISPPRTTCCRDSRPAADNTADMTKRQRSRVGR